MISIYNIKKNTFKEGTPYLLVELRGLSTDVKPTILNNSIIDNGSVFIEIDTQKVYIYDLSNQEWLNPTDTPEETDENNENEEEQVGDQ